MKVELAQSQTIQGDDGFPIENLKFCGGAQEIMAVIQGNKFVAASDFDREYTHMNFITYLKGKKQKIPEFHSCEPYTYEDVYSASKKVKLYRYPYNKIDKTVYYYYFLKKNMNDTFLLDCLWGKKGKDIQVKYDLTYDETNIIVGILLGYKKEDICSWFLMELEGIFKINFDNLDKREAFIKRPSVQKEKEKIMERFEIAWKSAVGKLATMRKELKIPAGWRAKLSTLPSPKSSSQTRRNPSKGGRRSTRKRENE